MSLARRTIASATWNIIASIVTVGVLFVRYVILARLLPVEAFDDYYFASAVVMLSAVLPVFGMGGAFLHRARETEDEGEAAAVHFTLKLLFTLAWAALLMGMALLFTTGGTRTALLMITATTTVLELTQTPRLILVRRVVHRRLALVRLLSAFLTTLSGVGFALVGAGLWALLAADVVSRVFAVVALYVWRPVWKPRLSWSPEVIRYFLRFGVRNFVATALLEALDKVDDLWTRLFLAANSLGYYGRAYGFANYPRRFLAEPINNVVRGTYAELKGDRRRLSQAFFRINAFLVRSGFLLAGLLALIAPEIILLLLTEKWLPMLDAFRLMLVFTLLDPIKISVSYVFVAVGKPERVMQARALQFAVMLVGLFALGPWQGIAGVALAVDLMLVVGIGLMLWWVREFVDYSVVRLFLAPGLALVLGLVLGRAVIELPGIRGSHWRTAGSKAVVFCLAYGAVWLFLERRWVSEVFGVVRGLFLRPARTPLGTAFRHEE
jgi:O-antigen/teichoic acid export membrane protein